ncbi:MAG: biopolymer transporter ExbD [Pseudomonadota bacterium]
MSMNVSTSGTHEPMCDVNTTPLIDVMLVLLVMLIVTLPVQNHAVKLDMPIPTNTPVTPSERIVIELDADGTIIWNGGVVGGIAALDQLFAGEEGKDPAPEIHLLPARRVKYDVVANVLASAQRHNMTKLGFANVAEFAD